MTAGEDLAGRLEEQAKACAYLGSGLYAELLTRCAEDVREAGPAWRVLEPFTDEAEGSALALRLMAAVHRLVLSGDAPGLARHYPSAGGSAADGAWAEFRALLVSRMAELQRLTALPMQTNEVGRSAPLVVGLIAASSRSPVPIRLLEIGASAGLNLAWDRYCFEAGDRVLGTADSPVRFSAEFRDGLPEGPDPAVIERRGCDAAPLDLREPEDRLRLVASTWADQPKRIQRLRAAIEVSRGDPPPVDRASAGEWLEAQLRENTHAGATVVFHSIVWQYLSSVEQDQIVETMQAFAQSNPDHPLHHLSMDRGGKMASLTLTTWPGGSPTGIASTGYHGDPVILAESP